MKCRHCQTPLQHVFVDLGTAPPSNAYLTADQLAQDEPYYPLKVFACETCWLVQIDEFEHHSALFDEQYAYFSSYSSSWLKHAESYVNMISKRLTLHSESLVVEVASNDGYLLQYFQQQQIPCLGIEPTASTAGAARDKGIDVIERFFGAELANELCVAGRQADLLVGNNVIAHVPDINDFVQGLKQLLKPDGVITLEFPHLLHLVEQRQFDTIYHEHFSYLSLGTLKRIFEAYGLSIFDVEKLSTHGGSLRVYSQHSDGPHAITPSVASVLDDETAAGVSSLQFYSDFQPCVARIRDDLCEFLQQAKADGRRVAAYGAAAKGNTLLNFADINVDLISYVVDRNPAKQGKFMPGNRIPIVEEQVLRQLEPDYLLILPWNLKDEITEQLAYAAEWGCQFFTAIPRLREFKP